MSSVEWDLKQIEIKAAKLRVEIAKSLSKYDFYQLLEIKKFCGCLPDSTGRPPCTERAEKEKQ